MSKVKIKNLDGKNAGDIELPQVFNTPIRPDLIKRAVLSEQSKLRQPQGRYKLAGRLTVAESTGPGRGRSLVPVTGSSRTHHASRGAVVPSTRGGRLAHPPRVEKNIVEKMNKKEHRLALKSAVSATKDPETVRNRGHRVADDTEFPIIVKDEFTKTFQTKKVIETLGNLGLDADLERAKNKNIRSGKGKMRGRKYRRRKGPLIVVAESCNLEKASKNIAGVEVVEVDKLTVDLLAPGYIPGRATVWTEGAISKLAEWN